MRRITAPSASTGRGRRRSLDTARPAFQATRSRAHRSAWHLFEIWCSECDLASLTLWRAPRNNLVDPIGFRLSN